MVWLNNAFRLMQLPLGLFGVGLATVSLPTLAGHATAGISPEFKSTLAKNLRFVALLSLPSAVGLVMLADPIMSLIYGHGAARSATPDPHPHVRTGPADLCDWAGVLLRAEGDPARLLRDREALRAHGRERHLRGSSARA